MNRTSLTLASTIASALLVSLATLTGCSSDGGQVCLDGDNCGDQTGGGGPVPGATDPGSTAANAPPAPMCADTGKTHVGLGGVDLTAGRDEAPSGADRVRMKPYSVLATDYARVLGQANNPTLIGQSASTFGAPVARWYNEPQPSAVVLYQAYRVGFEGCEMLTGVVQNSQGATAGDPKFQTMPDTASATTQCQQWTRQFWSRDATPDELNACVSVAVTDSVSETISDNGNLSTQTTTAPRRWAYACATVLTATGFLAY